MTQEARMLPLLHIRTPHTSALSLEMNRYSLMRAKSKPFSWIFSAVLNRSLVRYRSNSAPRAARTHKGPLV
jgi:hypothetical protein